MTRPTDRLLPPLWAIMLIAAFTVGLLTLPWIPGLAPRALEPRFNHVYPLEGSAADAYNWVEPSSQIIVPSAQIKEHVIIAHRLTAGPNGTPPRTLTINSEGVTTEFQLKSGAPGRLYRYILPTDGHTLQATYAISPLKEGVANDNRNLGFIVYAQPAINATILTQSFIPSIPTLALTGFLVCVFITLRIWGLRRHELLVGLALVGLITLFYYAYPRALLQVGLIDGMWRGIAVIAVCGTLCQLLIRDRSSTHFLLALSIAAVTLPLIYVLNGLWNNLGRNWDGLHWLLLSLLMTPILLGGLTLLQPSLWVRRITTMVTLAAVCGFGFWNIWNELPVQPYDFTIYWEAAQRFREGGSIYETVRMVSAPFDVYKYHPSFLGLILPLTSLDLPTASLTWKLLNLIALVLGVGLVLFSFFRTQRWVWFCALLLLCNLAPIARSIRLGQIDGLLVLGIALAITLCRTRWGWITGLLWAALGVMKVYPFVLIASDLVARRWRLLLMSVISTATILILSGVLLGWEHERTFWQEVVPSLGDRTTRLSNQSLYGLIGRTLYPETIYSGNRSTDLPLVSLIHAPVALSFALLTGWALWRSYRSTQRTTWPLESASLLICMTLLIIPVSWDHYQTILLLPLLSACAIATHYVYRRLLIVGAFMLLAFGTYKQLQIWLVDQEFLILLASYRTFGLILLWFWWITWLLHASSDEGVERAMPSPNAITQVVQTSLVRLQRVWRAVPFAKSPVPPPQGASTDGQSSLTSGGS